MDWDSLESSESRDLKKVKGLHSENEGPQGTSEEGFAHALLLMSLTVNVFPGAWRLGLRIPSQCAVACAGESRATFLRIGVRFLLKQPKCN